MKLATEHFFTGTTQSYASGYDSTKTNLGQWIQQKTGNTVGDKYAGPFAMSIARPAEFTSTWYCPHVVDAGGGIHWVFLADFSTAATTRKIALYTFNTATQVWSFKGYITLTYPTATNHTITSLKVARHTNSTGTVTVSGTTVTGVGTKWATSRYAAGARIGFGTTDPSSVTTWYYISAITNDNTLTLSSSITVAGGSSFVIEELRVYTVTTNATATNGGLYVAKGVNFDDFNHAGTTISAATTVDNAKAVYWLADASTVTNTTAAGLVLDTQSDTSQYAYILNSESTNANARIYKYDVRTKLTSLSSGKSIAAFTLKTSSMPVPSGTIGTVNSITIATTNHGPGSGVACIYGVTTTRVYRIPLTSVIATANNFVSCSMIADFEIESPPGGSNTYANTGSMATIAYDSSIDRFLIGSSSVRSYLTKYDVDGNSFTKIIFVGDSQQDRLNVPKGHQSTFPATGLYHAACMSGIFYLLRATSSSSTINQMYATPIGADWDYAAGTSSANQNRLITPSLSTVNCNKFYRVSVSAAKYTGDANLGWQTQPYRVYCRTTGIVDDSGVWVLVGDNGDISHMPASNTIQFMFEFRVTGATGITAKIYGLTCTYEDHANDGHFQPSSNKSIATSKTFAWRLSSSFGGSVPSLTVKYFDALNGGQVLVDTTVASAYGTFTKSTDGTTWTSYNSTDKANETTYIRYTPTAFPDNIKAKAVLMLSSTALTAAFTASPTSSAIVPKTGSVITFTDLSYGQGGPVNWSWDFGDGTTSTSQNPSKTYYKSGNYTIKLTVSNADSSASLTKTSYLTITDVLDNGPRWGYGGDPTATFTVKGEGTASSVTGGRDVNSRIPTMTKTSTGALLFFSQMSSQVSTDFGVFGIFCKRSTDNGVTWSDPVEIYNYASFLYDGTVITTNGGTGQYVSLGAAVSDVIGVGGANPSSTLLFTIKTPGVYAGGVADAMKTYTIRSTDDGVTWGAATDINSTTNNSSLTYTIASVDTSLDRITLSSTPSPALVSGQAVAFSTNNTLPSPLVAAGPGNYSTSVSLAYYIFMVSPTVFSVHTSYAGGLDGTTNKVDLTTSGSGTNSINFTWYWTIPTSTGIQLGSNSSHPGRLLVGGDHRTAAVSGPSYAHVLKSDDGGATWSIGGYLTENTTNVYQNETAVAELSISDKILMNSRNVNGSSRNQAISVDAGATWQDVTNPKDATISNIMNQSDTLGSMLKLGSILIVATASDTAERRYMTLWVSQDDGMTWVKQKIIYYRYASYSAMIALDDEHFIIVFESAPDDNFCTANYIKSSNFTMDQAIINKTWLMSSTPVYSEYFFNEHASGIKPSSYAPNIIDYGQLNAKARVVGAMSLPSYSSTGIVLSDSSADCICLSPPLDGLLTPAAASIEFQPNSGESMTWEVEATLTGNGVIMSSLLNGKGFQLESNGGFLKGTVADGSTTITTTSSTTTVNDSTRRAYAMARDAANGLLKLYVNGVLESSIADTTGDIRNTKTGVYVGQSPLLPFNKANANNRSGNVITLGVTHGWADGQAVIFTNEGPGHGNSLNGTLPSPLVAGTVYYVRNTGLTATQIQLHTSSGGAIANTGGVTLTTSGNEDRTVCYVTAVAASAPYSLGATIHSSRITRGLVSPESLQVVNRTKTDYRTYRNNFSPTIPAWTPNNLSSLVTWMFPTVYQGEYCYADDNFGLTHPLPWTQRHVVKSMRDRSSNQYMFSSIDSRLTDFFPSDTNVGPYYKLVYNSAATAASFWQLRQSSLATKSLYDFMITTGPNGNAKFSIGFAIRFDSNAAGGNIAVFDTSYSAAAGSPGVIMRRDTSSHLSMSFYDSTSIGSASFSGVTFSNSNWYFILMACNGLGAAVDMYYTPLSGTYSSSSPYTPATCTKVTSSSLGAGSGTPTTTWPLTIGQRGDGSNAADISIKNLVICNNTLGQTDADNLAAFCVKG